MGYTTHTCQISSESSLPFVRYYGRTELRQLTGSRQLSIGFRASSAISKRLDGFLSNLADHWYPVARRYRPNFVSIRSADRFRPFASDCRRPNLTIRVVGSWARSCAVRMPFANANGYPHEIIEAKAAWRSLGVLQISSQSDEPFRKSSRRTEPSIGYNGPAVLAQ